MAATDPLAHWPARTVLADPGGRTVLVYTPADTLRAGRRWADGVWCPPDIHPDLAAAVATRELAGWALSTEDRGLVTALLGRGAVVLRHAHLMSLDLCADPPLVRAPDDVCLSPLDSAGLRARAADVAEVAYTAHADDGEGWPSLAEATEAMRAAAAGEPLGRLLASSCVATRDDAVVGACLVVDRAGDPPAGGPWVLDVFRDPADPARRIGAAMLSQSVRSARAAGLSDLSLAVTHANAAARRLYERFGFADLGESWTLAMPV